MSNPAIVRLSGTAVPASLRGGDRPAPVLYVRGALPPPARPRVAVVGSRTPSASGEAFAYALGHGLARAGVVVVSGLARGIDAAAHRGAVDAGGASVAFLGCGVDVVYPRSCRQLAERLVVEGALASEYRPGAGPRPYRFVERNRLIARYTVGTVVVEAGARSGALITAGLAVEASRELWAVPGDPRRPTCAGSNRLIRDGAGVVLDAADLLAALGLTGGAAGADEAAPPPGLSKAATRCWRALAERGSADAETLSRRTGLPVAELLEALSVLELGGHLRREPGAFALVPRDEA